MAAEPLSINPQALLVTNVSGQIQSQIQAAQAAAGGGISNLVSKAGLDSVVNQQGGGITSGLNGLTSQIQNAGSGALSTLTNAAGTASLPGGLGSLGGIGNQVQSAIGGIGLGSIGGGITNGLSTLAVQGAQLSSGITKSLGGISGSLSSLAGGDLAGGLKSLAGTISSAAGVLNNILSLKRGTNLPSGGELFSQQGPAIRLFPGTSGDWRVRINCAWENFNSPLFAMLQRTGGVVWPYNPNITVSTKAEYNTISPIHNNYPLQQYKSSTVEDITISGEFSCETETDAAYWIAATTFFKTATKMFFGQGNNAGNPPIVCHLNGYGSSIFNEVPVVIKSFSVELKDDVNYVNCNTWGTNTWVPVLSTITVVVAPVYNRRRLRQFSLQQYASGQTAFPNGGGVGYF